MIGANAGNALMIQIVAHAIIEVKQDANANIEAGMGYTQNEIWRLVREDEETFDKWNLYFEGRRVFTKQQNMDHDFYVSYVDFMALDDDTLDVFLSYAIKKHSRFCEVEICQYKK